MLGSLSLFPSLRSQSASLSTFPEDFRCWNLKELIYRGLSDLARSLSATKWIFLPALREAALPAAGGAAIVYFALRRAPAAKDHDHEPRRHRHLRQPANRFDHAGRCT